MGYSKLSKIKKNNFQKKKRERKKYDDIANESFKNRAKNQDLLRASILTNK